MTHDRKLQTTIYGGHYKPKLCNKTLEYDDVLKFLCQNACPSYRGILSLKNAPKAV